MGMQQYSEVVEDLCDAAGIEEAATVLANGLICIGNIPARLQYLEASDQCRISMDLGISIAGREPELYCLLLESNFENSADCSPMLSMNPDTGHAVLMLHFPISRLCDDISLFELLHEQIDPLVEAWVQLIEEVPAPADGQAQDGLIESKFV